MSDYDAGVVPEARTKDLLEYLDGLNGTCLLSSSLTIKNEREELYIARVGLYRANYLFQVPQVIST
jgi:hypothetical protein